MNKLIVFYLSLGKVIALKIRRIMNYPEIGVLFLEPKKLLFYGGNRDPESG